MILDELIQKTSIELKDVSESPEIESEILACYVLGIDKSQRYKHAKSPISIGSVDLLDQLVQKRILGSPLEYITNQKAFYNDIFFVNNDVLIPRFETEILVEKSVEYLKNLITKSDLGEINILEIGTGSGCITVSILKEIEEFISRTKRSIKLNFVSTDISLNALKVAKTNAQNLIQRIEVVEDTPYSSQFRTDISNLIFENCDIITPIKLTQEPKISRIKYNLIVSNPPYIPTNELETLSNEVKNEPSLALDGGQDGLRSIERVIIETVPLRSDLCRYLIEIHSSNIPSLLDLLRNKLLLNEFEILLDLTGRERIITILI